MAWVFVGIICISICTAILKMHLESCHERRVVVTWNPGGRAEVFKTKVSVGNSMELLEGVVLLMQMVLMCHSWVRKASNHTAGVHSTPW